MVSSVTQQSQKTEFANVDLINIYDNLQCSAILFQA